jgi:hypothetical protein
MNPVYLYGTSTVPAQKPQSGDVLTRVWSMAVVGPLMVWGGMKLREEHGIAGTMLVAMGGAQALFGALSLLSTKR